MRLFLGLTFGTQICGYYGAIFSLTKCRNKCQEMFAENKIRSRNYFYENSEKTKKNMILYSFSKYGQKLQIVVKIRKFGQNSKIWSKLKIFGQNSKFSVKTGNGWSKFEISF